MLPNPQKEWYVLIDKVTYCTHPNCDKQPTYRNPHAPYVQVCRNHKEEGFAHIRKGNPCQHPEGCDTTASFALPKSNKGIYCHKHRPDDKYVNVCCKNCEKCDTRASYGKAGTKLARFCVEHKEDTHVDVRSPKCAECERQASVGFPGFSQERCLKHQKKGMVYHPRKRKRSQLYECAYCAAEINYDQDFCSGCKRYIDLGKTVKRHKKEETIKELLEKNFGSEFFRHDQRVDGGCSRRRPDFEISAEWGIIVLEIDEHQHNRKTYSCECETTRMRQLYFDYGVEHLLFIRYNPDSYLSLDSNGDEITTTKPERAKQREEFLVKYLREQRAERTFEHLGVVYLYYDGFSRPSVEIESLDPYSTLLLPST